MSPTTNTSSTWRLRTEFYQIAFRKKVYGSIEELQKDVDDWLEIYNQERPHSGRYCYGNKTMQTWKDSIHLAKAKQLDQYIEEKDKIKHDLTSSYGSDMSYLSGRV